ncbi:TPR Domain containing protein [Trichomonas vaginalis G3]|uniref:TPR Domain containing protein n=1 Tax=Trichomonas vaginalis (strain ATCC PRA-98 / G3) TaxID=412133 RepID=A2DP57_TRIV3|nr:positive regulation of catalytic activity protein [Trichomonas vaginalis G3]EAY17757.1 TPR Domain containing protein [Trichomonas vaginalis G3]KAI5484239.1 positive regulation of catalytic activity protein [Trichomonas vaginalis G3]|eukprot:XP_001329892.1 TPR Domain containing protein [Trichomonas vaginalis G3]
MNKERLAQCLILQYLESCASKDTEHQDELEVSIDCLKNLWKIDNPAVSIPGVNSIIDLIPEPKYDTDAANKLKVKGNEALSAGNVDEAIRYYTEAIKVDPSQHIFYCNRAAAYTTKGDYQAAIDDSEKAISLNPTFPKSYSRLGLALYKLNKIDEAREAYKRGIRACTDNQALKDNLASLGPEKPQGGAGNGANMAEQLGAMFANNPMFAQFAERLKDPSVQAMLEEPDMVDLLSQIQSNPAAIMSMMGDPRLQRLLGAIMGGR